MAQIHPHKALQLTYAIKSDSQVHRYYRRQYRSYSHPSPCPLYVWDRRVIFLKEDEYVGAFQHVAPESSSNLVSVSDGASFPLQIKSRSQCHLIAVSANH